MAGGVNPLFAGWSGNAYAGTQVFVSEHATETRARFPDKPWTKRRRRRVVGKFGSWTVVAPSAYRCGPALYVHPVIYDRMRRNIDRDLASRQAEPQ